MRAITFVHGGFAKVGGIETFTADLILGLNARQIQAELICWGAVGERGNQELENLTESGVKISRSSWRWGCRWGWPDRWMALRFWQKMMNADVLVFGKLLHSSIHRRLAEAKKRMILITPYRPCEMWGDRHPDKELLNSFETIVVQAQTFEDDLRAFGYCGQVVILPYLPPEVKEAGLWPSGSLLHIGFLGRLAPDKNLKYLIRSFSQLRENGIESQLHLFGDGSERDALLRLTDQMGLTEYVEFHGQLERNEIAAAIDQCHLFAFSSTTEGQCLASLEILARGRPVLATPVGAFPDFLFGVLGSIAPLDNAMAFATSLKALAKRVLSGEITPTDVQLAYKNRFPRCEVIDEYIRILGCLNSSDLMQYNT